MKVSIPHPPRPRISARLIFPFLSPCTCPADSNSGADAQAELRVTASSTLATTKQGGSNVLRHGLVENSSAVGDNFVGGYETISVVVDLNVPTHPINRVQVFGRISLTIHKSQCQHNGRYCQNPNGLHFSPINVDSPC